MDLPDLVAMRVLAELAVLVLLTPRQTEKES